MASGQWNLRNPAVKRIVQELKEIQRDDNPDIVAEALEVGFVLNSLIVAKFEAASNAGTQISGVLLHPQDNIFEWHFVIRGAWDTEFEVSSLYPAQLTSNLPATVLAHVSVPLIASALTWPAGRDLSRPHSHASGVPFQAPSVRHDDPQRSIRDWHKNLPFDLILPPRIMAAFMERPQCAGCSHRLHANPRQRGCGFHRSHPRGATTDGG